jgi:hypothetical protein
LYLDRSISRIRGKTYHRVLLRQSYREQGKVKHRTIANFSKCSPEEIEAIALALQHKKDLAALRAGADTQGKKITLQQGLSVGAVGLLHGLAVELGLATALGPSRQGKLALWQVIARVIDQGSRLSAVRLAGSHAACDILGLGNFNEEDLYANLDWLCAHQSAIEERLFRQLYPTASPELFLYDVTSSYLEGQHNELGAFGYNRDGKRGKKQIVIGLLCDAAGRALCIEVFAGNTPDTGTFTSQIQKVAARFGAASVSFVGDRGMIKGPQMAELAAHGFHYITAITKPQIEKLLAQKVLDMELFDEKLAEVQGEDVRYILRRNPQRAQELEASRASKLRKLREEVGASNAYLAGHPRASLEVALRRIRGRIAKLKLAHWLSARGANREIELVIDEEALAESSKLEGCYVLKTDLKESVADKQIVHARYKDLAKVEWAFRTSKTVELEMRPIHVRLEERTRGHALVVMLAYRLVAELAHRWASLNETVEEAIEELSTLCAHEVWIDGELRCAKIPQPRQSVARLLELAGVILPEAFPCRGIKVATKKKLQENRISN